MFIAAVVQRSAIGSSASRNDSITKIHHDWVTTLMLFATNSWLVCFRPKKQNWPAKSSLNALRRSVDCPRRRKAASRKKFAGDSMVQKGSRRAPTLRYGSHPRLMGGQEVMPGRTSMDRKLASRRSTQKPYGV